MGKMKDTTIPDFDQHSHDLLCPWSGSTEWDLVIGCHDCDLIAKVRKNQTQQCIEAVEAVPYITKERFLPHAPITVVEYRRHALAALGRE